MPMVGVAHVRMAMLQLPMAVLMGMPEGVLAGQTLQLFRGVIVLVVRIATAGIVAMAMGMQQRFVAMPVAVLLAQQQHHSCAHQPRRQQQGCGEGFPQNDDRKHCPHERSGGEQHGFAGGS